MDPFSITVGVLGITDFAISSISRLRDTINGLAEAKDVVQDIATSLEAIQRPLSALESLVISDSLIYAAAKEDIKKTGLSEAVNNCGKACDSFNKKLEQWTKHSSSAKMSLRDRLSVGVWNKEKIRTLRTEVQSCQSIVQFAVGSTQLVVQLRSENTAKADREEIKKKLQDLGSSVQQHITLTKKEENEVQKRKEEFQEEPEDEDDGGAQRTLALKEVEEQLRLLNANRNSSEALATQIKSHHTTQDIRDVKASADSVAVAGFINTVADPNLSQKISGVTAEKQSFAGAGVIMGLDFKNFRPSQSARHMSPFESLPVEIHDEIFHHFREQCTASFWDINYNCFQFDAYDYTRKIIRGYHHLFHPTLWNLRLVSKTISNSATRALFSHAFVEFHGFEDKALADGQYIERNAVRLLEERVLSPEARLTSIIKRAKITFGNQQHNHLANSFFAYGRSEESTNSFREFMELLPLTIAKLENLEILWIAVPGKLENVFEYRSGSFRAPNLDLDMLEGLRYGIALAFKSCTFDLLTDLRLTLPCAYDYFILNKSLSGSLLSRIRHLYLGYMDATGRGGLTRFNVRWDEGPLSNLQEKYPNSEYASSIFDIVNRCPRLESLGLSGTQRLDLGYLDRKPMVGLQCLYFSRGTVSSANLIQLLRPPANSPGPSPLFSLWLQDIEMTSGTWVEVFRHLLTCPSLSYFNLDNLTYAPEGESSRFRVPSYYGTEARGSIVSTKDEDESSLVELVGKLIERAGGKELYPHSHGETQCIYGH